MVQVTFGGQPLVVNAGGFSGVASNAATAAAASATRAGNAVPFATWVALAAATNMSALDRATVSASDTGTHTDPVIGGTVNNAGEYRYSASPAGWERVGNLDSQTAAGYADDATDSAADALAIAESVRLPDAGEPVWAITDGNDNAVTWADANHDLHGGDLDDIRENAAAGAAAAVITISDNIGEDGFSVEDEEGYSRLLVTDTEIIHPAFQALETDVANLQAGIGAAQVSLLALAIHFLTFSQSNGIGGDTVGIPVALTPGPLSYAYRFEGGVRPQDELTGAGNEFGSLVAYGETTKVNHGETPLGGMIEMWAQLALDRGGIAITDTLRKLIGSAPGEGSTTIAERDEGSIYFERLKDCVTYGKALSDSQLGLTYAMPPLAMIDGEGDTSSGTSYATFLSLQGGVHNAIEAHAQSVLGLGSDVPMPLFIMQFSQHPYQSVTTPDVARAQIDYCLADSRAVFVNTTHQYAREASIHYSEIGRKVLGAQIAYTMYRTLVEGNAPAPLVPTMERDGLWLLLRFPLQADRKLVIDTTFADPGNNGFQLVDSGGSPITISTSGLVQEDAYAIKAASTVQAGWKLRSGFVGNAASGYCRLRDDDPTSFDVSGTDYFMQAFVPIFEQTIS